MVRHFKAKYLMAAWLFHGFQNVLFDFVWPYVLQGCQATPANGPEDRPGGRRARGHGGLGYWTVRFSEIIWIAHLGADWITVDDPRNIK